MGFGSSRNLQGFGTFGTSPPAGPKKLFGELAHLGQKKDVEWWLMLQEKLNLV